jgi:hypothetical protein
MSSSTIVGFFYTYWRILSFSIFGFLFLKIYFDLECNFENHYFLVNSFGFIKNNITRDANILAYKIIQFVPINLFTITNEYAFNTFGIQFSHYFLSHMNECNTTKNAQMTYGRFVSTQNIFCCDAKNYLW